MTSDKKSRKMCIYTKKSTEYFAVCENESDENYQTPDFLAFPDSIPS